ncbi:hypothetical protein ACFL0J_03565 [Candidatus Neomarinimicrobiota bacterium]
MNKVSLLIFITFYAQNLIGQARTIIVTGDWNYTIPTTGITEAGEDFADTYESNIDQVILDVKAPQPWNVSINKIDIDWPGFILSVQRTGDGNGSRPVIGGIGYRVITSGSPVIFFSGDKNRQGIPIQYQIQNVSVISIPTGTYSATIVYTLTDQ